MDLTSIDGFSDAVETYLKTIFEEGVEAAVRSLN